MVTFDCPWCTEPVGRRGVEPRRARLRGLRDRGRDRPGSRPEPDRPGRLKDAVDGRSVTRRWDGDGPRRGRRIAPMDQTSLATAADALIRGGSPARRARPHLGRRGQPVGPARRRPAARHARPAAARTSSSRTTWSWSGSDTTIARHGRRAGSLPTSDLAIHLAVHGARPDIGAMAHAHLPASMALTLAGERPDPAALPETALLLPTAAVRAPRRAGQRRARRPSRRGADRAARAAADRRPPRASWRRRRRTRSGPGGRPARARRGPVPDVARCAPDPWGRAALGEIGGPGGSDRAG